MNRISAQTHDAPGLHGPADFCDDSLSAELFADYARCPNKIAEADADCDGMLDGTTYTEMQAALADLHKVEPCDLLGSDVLARVYRLARVCGQAREERLREMAEDDAARELRGMCGMSAQIDCDDVAAAERRHATCCVLDATLGHD